MATQRMTVGGKTMFRYGGTENGKDKCVKMKK